MFHAMRGGWRPLSMIALCLLVQLASGRTADAQVTYTVNISTDSNDGSCDPFNIFNPGPDCTLREAIIAANASPGFDRIAFGGFGVGTHTISGSELPAITETVTMDATGSGFRPGITQTGLPSAGDGLTIANGVGGVVIKGLAIYGFPDDGIEINGTGNHVINNYIGLNAAGTAIANKNGVRINGFSGTGDTNTIGGLDGANTRNVISGNTNYGIWIQSAADGNLVQGNYIGLNPAGTAAIPNGYGVQMHGGTGNITGGTTGTTPGSCTGACNVISGNSTNGIRIDAASNQSVVGNFIGTNPAGTGAIPNGVGINVQGDNNVVGGDTANERNVISGNTQDGIRLLGDTNTITGNYVGLNAAGTAGATNSTGISVGHPSDSRSAFGNTIGGLTPGERNVVSGNDNVGIAVHGNAGANTIIGNFVGTNPAGTAEIHNGSSGILIEADDNIIGGTNGVTPGGSCTGSCNLLSGNFNTGLTIHQNGTGNVIAGNMIGTDVTGTQDLGNLQGGVTLISVSGNFVGISALAIQGGGGQVVAGGNLISGNNAAGVQIADDLTSSSEANNNVVVGNLIGTNTTGTSALPNNSEGVLILGTNPDVAVSANVIEMNVLSGNSTGARISGANASANVIQTNLIGTDVSGQQPLPNSFFGIRLGDGAHDNTIGGTAAGQENIIAANGTGIRIGDAATTGNLIQGNFIGTNAGLDTGLGNVNEGVYLSNAAGNTIGGDVDGAGNVIAHNGSGNPDASGVRVQDADALGNRIWRNSIYSNAALGIQLDAGGNNDQEAPSLTSAVNGSTHVIGTLDSAPSTAYRIEFFASPDCDASGSGEGETFLGSANVNTNGAGHAAIDVTLAATAGAGEQVTGTATDPDGNTSEFSNCVVVTGAATPTPTPTPTPPGQTPTPTPTATATPAGQTPSPTPAPTPTRTPKQTGTPGAIQGDVTCDDEANSVDALFILREVAGLPGGACSENGDVNCDGTLTAVDALGVLRYVAGLPVNQNDPCAAIGTPL